MRVGVCVCVLILLPPFCLPFLPCLVSSYNKIQTDGLNEYGDWSCENYVTLKKEYKEVIGFKGWVMSDWVSLESSKSQREPKT